jgi:hypothetical protein
MDRARFIGTTAGFLAVGGRIGAAAAATGSRSLWVWRTPLAQAGALATFAQQNHFATLLLSIPSPDRSAVEAGDPRALGALRTLKNAGLVVYCTAGDPSWVKRSRTEPPTTVHKLLAAHKAYGVFEGVALDVEPHTLPEWKDGSRKDTLAANCIAVLGLIRSAASRLDLPVLATVHPTYAKYSPPSANGQTFLQAAAQAVDATALMAYRNSEEKLQSFAAPALEQLAGAGKSWWLGVSTHANKGPDESYASLPAAQFFPDIDATAADLEKRYGHGFQGIAVEDYRDTATLINGR